MLGNKIVTDDAGNFVIFTTTTPPNSAPRTRVAVLSADGLFYRLVGFIQEDGLVLHCLGVNERLLEVAAGMPGMPATFSGTEAGLLATLHMAARAGPWLASQRAAEEQASKALWDECVRVYQSSGPAPLAGLLATAPVLGLAGLDRYMSRGDTRRQTLDVSKSLVDRVISQLRSEFPEDQRMKQ